MLMIRLERVGRKHQSTYRVVVTDKRNAVRSGKSLEVVGSYNPGLDKPVLKTERVKHWLKNGAKASPTVHNLLVSNGVITGQKIRVVPKKKIAPVAEVKAEAKVETAPPGASTAAVDQTAAAE